MSEPVGKTSAMLVSETSSDVDGQEREHERMAQS
jgi:hypothetical protein